MSNIRDEGPAPYVIPLSADGGETLSFDPHAFSGWAAFHSTNPAIGSSALPLLIRVGPLPSALPEVEPDEPLEIKEVRWVSAGGSVSASLRAVPWERIEAAINHPVHREVIVRFVEPSYMVADDLPRPVGPWLFTPEFPVLPPSVDLQLDIPDGYRKPDEFYRQVAETFLSLASISSRPAQELAEANGVKPTTVHGWIREAKARRLLILPTQGEDHGDLGLPYELMHREQRERQVEVWKLLIAREYSTPPSWEQLFDDLPPDRVERLRELYDVLPEGARAEFDKRYGP